MADTEVQSPRIQVEYANLLLEFIPKLSATIDLDEHFGRWHVEVVDGPRGLPELAHVKLTYAAMGQSLVVRLPVAVGVQIAKEVEWWRECNEVG